ncbi:hypothetical protein PAMP_022857 [Pampus punctatissimus]
MTGADSPEFMFLSGLCPEQSCRSIGDQDQQVSSWTSDKQKLVPRLFDSPMPENGTGCD